MAKKELKEGEGFISVHQSGFAVIVVDFFVEGEGFYFRPPEWVREIKDDNVAAAIYSLLFSWTMDDEKHIDANLRDYIRKTFDDLSDKQVDEVVRILVEKGVVKLDADAH